MGWMEESRTMPVKSYEEIVSVALEILESEFDAYEGVCTNCLERQEGVEPDAEGYACESCGNNNVMGAEQALLIFG